jgi:small subunit ribosomal protein S6
MRRYETITIVDPDLSEEDRLPLYGRIKDLIPQNGGFLVALDEWGNKKLAYEIKKKPRGYYIRLDYCGTGALVDEMERFFRIDDRVLKYMTIVLDKAADTESLKEEMAKAKAKEDLSAEVEKSPAGQTVKEASEPEAASIETTQAPAGEEK